MGGLRREEQCGSLLLVVQQNIVCRVSDVGLTFGLCRVPILDGKKSPQFATNPPVFMHYEASLIWAPFLKKIKGEKEDPLNPKPVL